MKSRKRTILAIVLIALMAAGVCWYIYDSKQEKNNSTPVITTVDGIVGKKIGVQLGTTGDIYASDYESDGSGTVIERYNKANDAVSALKQNKIDCVIIDEEPAKTFAEKNSNLTILEEEFTVEQYAICLSKDNTELKEQINKAIKELKSEGTLDAIIDYYISGVGEAYESPAGLERKNGTLTMATNAQFPPYESYEDGEIVGIDADIAKAIADYLGMTLKINDMEFDAIINSVVSKKADIGVAGMTVTEDRLVNVDFSDSYTTSKQVIIVNNGEESQDVSLQEQFHDNFIKDGRWKYITKGLLNTIIIAVFAVIVGIFIGFVVGIIRATHDKSGAFGFLNVLCNIYLTVLRGTPVLVQLLIMYYVVFGSLDINKVLVCILAFGLNSGAYVAEIIRGGIMAIDKGQFEAGRSLGLNFTQTMIHIIMPQVFKNVLPALANEFIVLLKETSVCGYIGLGDLTRGGDIIRSKTFEAFLPLTAVALIYLCLVMILSAGVKRLERRLRRNER